MLRTSAPLIATLDVMEIDPDLYEDVLSLAESLVAATEQDYDSLYAKLRQLCEKANDSPKSHPFFYETLADFTLNDQVAIDIYMEALQVADKFELNEHQASIQLPIAYLYQDLGDHESAFNCGTGAKELAKSVGDKTLTKEIKNFLKSAKK